MVGIYDFQITTAFQCFNYVLPQHHQNIIVKGKIIISIKSLLFSLEIWMTAASKFKMCIIARQQIYLQGGNIGKIYSKWH